MLSMLCLLMLYDFILFFPEMSSEEELGISEFISEGQGFSGLIKERFSDFNVYEINKTGQVVHLDNQEIPADAESDVVKDPELSYTNLTDKQRILMSEEEFLAVKSLMNSDLNTSPVKINVTDIDKDGRKEIHLILKRFPKIDSNTSEVDGVKFIEARLKSKSSSGGGRRDWPRERPKHLHFSLYKENMETAEAIGQLANKCRSMEKYFGFAGTKDRRGRTVQRVSVSMVSAKQILGAAKHIHKLEVGSFSYNKTEIRLGDLSGNRFELVVRNVEANKDDLVPVMRSLSERGFINYFGTQRFGTQGIPTHSIGKELIMGRYSEAVDLILKPRDSESNEAFRKCRQIWSEERDASKALQILKSNRKDRTIEGKLLFGLSKSHKNDVVGALESLPRPQRLLYCHAYQSYIWNKVVSKRIKNHGLKVLKGDLVFKKKDADQISESKEDLVETVEDQANYTIQDVLIPIPGTKVKFPDNEVKTWFNEFLAEDDMSLESFDSSVKDYRLPGDYRAMVVLPGDVNWSLVSHEDPLQDLIPSDKDALENKAGTSLSLGNELGKYSSLILKFSLPSSSYATMALREVMKVGTDRQSMMMSSKASNLKRTNCDTQPPEQCDTVPAANKVPKL